MTNMQFHVLHPGIVFVSNSVQYTPMSVSLADCSVAGFTDFLVLLRLAVAVDCGIFLHHHPSVIHMVQAEVDEFDEDEDGGNGQRVDGPDHQVRGQSLQSNTTINFKFN